MVEIALTIKSQISVLTERIQFGIKREENIMSISIILELTKRAKEDPVFFHTLIFSPDKALEQIKRETGGSSLFIKKLNPSSIIASALGLLQNECGPDTTSSGPCGVTCGGRTCDVTCTAQSCGNTCGNSCGYTTDFI